MWPRRVVVVDPFGKRAAGVVEAEEQALVEELVAHAAVEALDVAVLHGLAFLDVVPVHQVVLRPGEDGIRGELGAVVRDAHAWLAAAADQLASARAPRGDPRSRCRR